MNKKLEKRINGKLNKTCCGSGVFVRSFVQGKQGKKDEKCCALACRVLCARSLASSCGRKITLRPLQKSFLCSLRLQVLVQKK